MKKNKEGVIDRYNFSKAPNIGGTNCIKKLNHSSMALSDIR